MRVKIRSSSLSSAIRMVGSWARLVIGFRDVRLVDRQCHNKSSALSGRAFGGNLPIVPFGDFPADGQPHAGALEFAATMQALKHREDTIQIFFVKPNAIVFH